MAVIFPHHPTDTRRSEAGLTRWLFANDAVTTVMLRAGRSLGWPAGS
jgi:hypothetical protein